jgi:hypothetical protein
MSCTPFDIHRSNVNVANMQLGNASFTFVTIVFCYYGRQNFLHKNLFAWEHNPRT